MRCQWISWALGIAPGCLECLDLSCDGRPCRDDEEKNENRNELLCSFPASWSGLPYRDDSQAMYR